MEWCSRSSRENRPIIFAGFHLLSCLPVRAVRLWQQWTQLQLRQGDSLLVSTGLLMLADYSYCWISGQRTSGKQACGLSSSNLICRFCNHYFLVFCWLSTQISSCSTLFLGDLGILLWTSKQTLQLQHELWGNVCRCELVWTGYVELDIFWYNSKPSAAWNCRGEICRMITRAE